MSLSSSCLFQAGSIYTPTLQMEVHLVCLSGSEPAAVAYTANKLCKAVSCLLNMLTDDVATLHDVSRGPCFKFEHGGLQRNNTGATECIPVVLHGLKCFSESAGAPASAPCASWRLHSHLWHPNHGLLQPLSRLSPTPSGMHAPAAPPKTTSHGVLICPIPPFAYLRAVQPQAKS